VSSITIDRPEFRQQDTRPLAVDVHGLTKRYGDLAAVNEIDFSLDQGEVFAFLGPKASGDPFPLAPKGQLTSQFRGHVGCCLESPTSTAADVPEKTGGNSSLPPGSPRRPIRRVALRPCAETGCRVQSGPSDSSQRQTIDLTTERTVVRSAPR
jgi:hypothetical protein